jgi:hypothetical protein
MSDEVSRGNARGAPISRRKFVEPTSEPLSLTPRKDGSYGHPDAATTVDLVLEL